MSERPDLKRSGSQFGGLQGSRNNKPEPMRGPGPGPGRGPMGMVSMVEKAKDFKGTMKTLLGYLRPYWLGIVISIFLSIISTVFTIIGPKFMGDATTAVYEGAVAKLSQIPGAGIDFYYIGNIILLLVIFYVVSAACQYAQGAVMARIAMKVTYEFRKRISQKISRLPLKYFDRVSYGDVQSRVVNDVDTVATTLNQGLTQIVTAVTTILGITAMMFTISWIMTLAALVMLPVSLLFVTLVIRKSQKFYKDQQRFLGLVNGHVEEMYSGHNVMKAFNGEEKSIQKFTGLNTLLYGSAWKSQFFTSLMMPATQLIGNLGYVVICILGGYLTITGSIKVGDIQAFIQYVRNFQHPITQTAGFANVMQTTAAAAERVFEFLDSEEEIEETAEPVDTGKISGKVTFDHISFGYNPETTVIKDFCADIKAGQKVAIVGPTGAGKTTIVKLLMRFYDVNEGAILIDDIDIRHMRRSDLRSNFGMVLQDTWLFNGSIRENIRYGRHDASDDEVVEAAKTAYINHFIHTLPNGYDMVLNEEASNVSQGEKQLLTIARAVLADPKILILDEATSSVDTRTEILIQKAMEDLMKGRTCFIIAHRLSTIRNADTILVMRDGEIVEQGSHKELLEADGFYASLYNSQFEAVSAISKGDLL
jgi:ATP-binding cassette, subfamily B, multidrug efflux pump